VNKLDQIKKLVKEYIEEKKANESYTPGVDFVKYSGGTFDENEYQAAIETLLNGWLCFGKKCSEFETKFADIANLKYGVLTNSGSSANLLMISALKSSNKINKWKLEDGDKVITPVVCFPTTINPLFQNNLIPVFVDVTLPSLNLDLDKVEEMLDNWKIEKKYIDIDKRTITMIPNPKPKAILFAHVLGNPPDMDRVMEICKKHNLILLEDCCDALGSTWKGQKLGTFGLMSTSSFYPAHHMTMGEGGFIATNENRLKTILNSFRDWGRACYCNQMKPGDVTDGTACGNRFNKWLPGLPEVSFDHRYVFDEIGYNLKPLEIQAAIGLEQIKKLPELEAARRHNFNLLHEIFSPFEDSFHLPEATVGADPCWFGFLVTLKDGTSFTKQDLVDYFEENKIQTRSYFTGNALAHPAYFKKTSDKIEDFPVANYVTENTFFLGTFIGITEEMMKHIFNTLEDFMGGARAKKCGSCSCK
jgi:CDP-6-deoxy-D-xylo-4-hexulose-3-dehydrase